jgi:hypothetical protein
MLFYHLTDPTFNGFQIDAKILSLFLSPGLTPDMIQRAEGGARFVASRR